MSSDVYNCRKWFIKNNHGWKVWATTKGTKDLYGAYNHGKWFIEKNHGWKVWTTTKDIYEACPNIKVIIGDVSIGKHFFVEEKSFYLVIHAYITTIRTEMKLLDNRSTFMWIRSLDGRKLIYLLTIEPNHVWNKEHLHPLGFLEHASIRRGCDGLNNSQIPRLEDVVIEMCVQCQLVVQL